ncbi:response regulator transcription factor [Paenibacillus flagellatus]|uniref:DNA-binding response regulator n=1 Tax=Paenibacillus flagellatus TaxID=2211139 RepID=A0A2V5KEL9_9BACL|nr:response regulator [Paenibacillus flagellatus]PYI56583.1 DNA-binding response regulator [Paenibacillus flagellatus]
MTVIRTKVLVADDEAPIRDSLRLFGWARHDLELVGVARHGREAMELSLAAEPEIVVTDIVMPVMDGLRLTRRLKEWKPDVQIILLTCHSDFDYVREALVLGACDYLLKGTYREEDLVAALNKAKERIPGRNRDDAGGDKRYEIREALAFIRDHLREPFGLPEVAAHVGLSANYFGLLFRRETGEPFQDYVKRERLEKAAYLLRHSAMKVYEVAAETGFPSYRYFTDVFCKRYGKSPREYRGSHG